MAYPVEDTVYFDPAATVECAAPASPQTVREVSALAILDGTQGYGELVIRDMGPVLGAEPSPGSVIDQGGTVTVHVMGSDQRE